MTVTGTMEAPQVKGDFLAFDGSVMGELFQSISGEYTYDGNDITLKMASPISAMVQPS